jgi:excisionase family DNA binding protein
MRPLACSRSVAYRLTHSGALPVVRLGRAVRVPASALDDFIRSGGVAVMPPRAAEQATKPGRRGRGA